MTEAETETVETPAEEVHDPAAVLAKNKALLSDLAKLKSKAAALEELARDLGLDDAALADPRAHIAKRADESRAAKERERTIREAVLLKLVDGRRRPDDVNAFMSKVLADPNVKFADGKVTGLDAAIARAEPKRAAPGLPDIESLKARPAKPAPDTFEKLVESGPEALASFARQSPGEYEKLREDWQRRLANPSARR